MSSPVQFHKRQDIATSRSREGLMSRGRSFRMGEGVSGGYLIHAMHLHTQFKSVILRKQLNVILVLICGSVRVQTFPHYRAAPPTALMRFACLTHC